MTHDQILQAAGLSTSELTGGGTLAVRSPIDGAVIAHVHETNPADMGAVIARSQAAFQEWRDLPAPRRGELVRLLGEELRAAKAELGALVTLEVGKITSEGLGEVQEMIDICDFAVGLSRQIYGLTIASERPGHRMMGKLAPDGSLRRHLGLQLPGCGLVLEHRPCPCLRRSGDLEALGKDPAHRHGFDEDHGTRAETLRPRCARRPRATGHRRPRHRRSTGELQGRAHCLGHRLDPYGLHRRPKGRITLGPLDSRTWRQ